MTVDLQLQRLSVCYWQVAEPQLYSQDKFPGFIFSAPLGKTDMHIYGFPVAEYPGLIKVIMNADILLSHDGHTDLHVNLKIAYLCF